MRKSYKKSRNTTDKDDDNNIFNMIEENFSTNVDLKKIENLNKSKQFNLVKNYNYCFKFYKNSYEDFIRLNLKETHRPWFSFKNKINNKIINGKKAFDNLSLFRPVQVKRYINHHFIKDFEEDYNPFSFPKDYIDIENIEEEEFDLKPQQMFCSNWINYGTDQDSLLLWWGLGSGKTIGALALAEANKSKYIKECKNHNIPGREIYQLTDNASFVNKPVVIVCPKYLINQYKDDLIGKIENGKPVSGTGQIVIYTEEDDIYNKHPEDDSEMVTFENSLKRYRQYYVCKYDDGEYNKVEMKTTYNIDNNDIIELNNKMNKLNKRIYEIESNKNRIYGKTDTKTSSVNFDESIFLAADDDEDKNKPIGNLETFNIPSSLDEIYEEIETEEVMTNDLIVLRSELDRIKNKLKDLEKLRETKKEQIKKSNQEIMTNINQTYFIISYNTFIERLFKNSKRLGNVNLNKDDIREDVDPDLYNDEEKLKFLKSKMTKKTEKEILDKLEPSNFLKGTGQIEGDLSKISIGNSPDKAFFKLEDSVIIIDEIHKLVSEKGITYKKLEKAIREYAVDSNGNKTLKIVLMTATPIFDNVFNFSATMNLFRPRLYFPKKKKDFNKFFIENNDKLYSEKMIKNPLLLKYMLSGYVSYFKGGNPNYYPRTRFVYHFHKMSSLQFDEYVKSITFDLKDMKDSTNKQSLEDELIIEEDDDINQTFNKSIATSICALPDYQGDDYSRLTAFKKSIISNPLILKDYSEKLFQICSSIVASSKREFSGPRFVNSRRIARGLLPILSYLQTQGFYILTINDLKLSDEQLYYSLKEKGVSRKTIGLWKGELHKRMSAMNKIYGNEDEYKDLIQQKYNSKLNINGELCKVLLANVDEGISLFNTEEADIVSEWWNRKRTQQIIARTIRFKSHVSLPLERRYVKINLHCSILPEYPRPSIKEEGLNLKFFSKISIEQFIATKARIKYDIDTKFNNLIKECAIDYDLNKNANIDNLVEVNFSDEAYNVDGNLEPIENIIRPSGIDYTNERLYYNEAADKYYLYNINQQGRPILNEIDMIYTESDKSSTTVWPARTIIKTNKNIVPDSYKIYQDNYGKIINSFSFIERIKSFYDTEYAQMNFYELKEKAIEQGEEESVWNSIFNNRLINFKEIGTMLESANINTKSLIEEIKKYI